MLKRLLGLSSDCDVDVRTKTNGEADIRTKLGL